MMMMNDDDDDGGERQTGDDFGSCWSRSAVSTMLAARYWSESDTRMRYVQC